MMKADEPNLNPKKLIYVGKKKINRKLNIYLFNKISFSFEISTLVSKKSSHKMEVLYIESSYRIENVNFNINKNSLFFRWNT